MSCEQIYLRKFEDDDIDLFTYWVKKDYISKWYKNPDEWMDELKNRQDKFKFVNHYIVMHQDTKIGFCQYYDCYYAKEEWYEVNTLDSLFSIDYLIGDEEYLHKGYGKAIIELLTSTIANNTNAKQIVVQPERENIPSQKALLSAGYTYDEEKNYYFFNIHKALNTVDSYLNIVNQRKQIEIANIKKCNEYTSQYGLTLSDNQIKNIVEKRKDSLQENGRVEFREGIIDKLIKEFCDSPYINKENYAQTIYELIDIFYEYKNETIDLITDDELITFMKKAFDGICQGDIEYLEGTVMYKMRENLFNRKPIEYLEDSEDYE